MHERFFLTGNVVTGFEVQRCQSPSELRRARRECDHSPLPCAEVKNKWKFTSTPTYAFVPYIGTNLLLTACFTLIGSKCPPEHYILRISKLYFGSIYKDPYSTVQQSVNFRL